MNSEFTLVKRHCLGYSPYFLNLIEKPHFLLDYHNFTLDLAFLDVVHAFSRYYEHALLGPFKHIDLLDLIRKKQCFYCISYDQITCAEQYHYLRLSFHS